MSGIWLASFPGPRARFTLAQVCMYMWALARPGHVREVKGAGRRMFAWARTAAVLRQRWKAANLYFLQLLIGVHLYHRPSAETMSRVEGREVQPSFERSRPTRN